MVSFPLSILNLRTCYFKIHMNTNPPEDVKHFANITWEVLNILKENFPSKLHLYQENLECCAPVYKPLKPREELRRQISCALSKKETPKLLLREEIEDVWYILEGCRKFKESKGVTACLELLDSNYHCPSLLLSNTSQPNQELLHSIIKDETYDSSTQINETLAKKILLKIDEHSPQYDLPRLKPKESAESHKTQELDRTQTPSEFTFDINEREEITSLTLSRSYDKPSSLRLCLFQMAESHDLQRVTFILEMISKYSNQEIKKLKKNQLSFKTLHVMKKYCHGDYGFDSEVAKLGYFQYFLMKVLIISSEYHIDFMDYMYEGIFDQLGQIMEESVIFIYDSTINGYLHWNSKSVTFLHLALDYLSLTINVKCSKFFNPLQKTLIKLEERLLALTHEEVNIAKVFKSHFQNKIISENSIERFENEDLRTVSPLLFHILIRIREMTTKIHALTEYGETHADKFKRYFPDGYSNIYNIQTQPLAEIKRTKNINVYEQENETSFKHTKAQTFAPLGKDKEEKTPEEKRVALQTLNYNLIKH